MFNKLLLIIILFSVGQQDNVKCGIIKAIDFHISYMNYNFAQRIKVIFELENKITEFNFLQLKLQKTLLHKTVTVNNQPVELTANYQTYSLGVPSQSSRSNANVFYSSIDQAYYFQFLDLNNYNTGLSANQGYQLNIYIQNGLSTSTLELVSLFTVSSMNPSYIIFDSNPAFGFLDIAAPPPQTLNAIFFSSDASRLSLDTTYLAQVDVYLQEDIINESVIVIQMDNQNFQFIGAICQSLSSFDPIIYALSKDVYTCSIDSITNQVRIELSVSVSKGNKFRFQFYIRNPNTIQTGGLIVLQLYKNSEFVVSYNTIQKALYTEQQVLVFNKCLLGWGVDLNPQLSQLRPAQLMVLRSPNIGPLVYNSIQLSFYSSVTLITTLRLAIQVSFKDTVSTVCLIGSIQENFSPCFGQVVKCTVDNVNAIINCANVCGMKQNRLYQIGFKVSIGFMASQQSLDRGFGNIQIFAENNNVLQQASLFQMLTIPYELSTANSLNWPIASTPNVPANDVYGNVHSIAGPFVANGINTLSNSGLKQDSLNKQILVFAFPGAAADFYPAFPAPTNPLSVPMAGVYLATSPSIYTNDTIFTFNNGNGPTGTLDLLSMTTEQSLVDLHYTEIRLGSNSATNLNALFTTNAVNGYSQVGINNVYVRSYSSPYAANEACIDFYGATVSAGMTTSNTVLPYKYFLFNSHAINAPSQINNLAGLDVQLSNFWASAGVGTQADKAPAFLRIFGFLSQSERSRTQKIVVFFQSNKLGLIFDDVTQPAKQSTVGCGFSAALMQNGMCYGYSGDLSSSQSSAHLMGRVEVDVSSGIQDTSLDAPFQIVIPVISLPFATPTTRLRLGLALLGFNIATDSISQENQEYMLSIFAFKQFNAYDFTQQTGLYTTNSNYIVTVAQLDVPTIASGTQLTPPYPPNSLVVGSALNIEKELDVKLQIGNYLNVLDTLDGNLLLQQGAAVIFNTAYQFYSCINTTIVSLGTSSSQCSLYSYASSIAVLGQRDRYGAFCSLGSSMLVNNPVYLRIQGMCLPSISGIDLPQSTYISASKNDGQMKILSQQPFNDVLYPNLLTLHAVSPNVLSLGFVSQRMVYEFSTTNPIPKNGFMTLTFRNNWHFRQNGGINLCRIVPVIFGYEYNYQYIQDHVCTVIESINSKIQCSISGKTIDFPPGRYYLITYGLNVNADPIDTNMQLNGGSSFVLSSQSSFGKDIDASAYYTLPYQNALVRSTLSLFNVYYKINVANITSAFQFSFIINNRIMVQFDAFTFYLPPVLQENINLINEFLCNVYYNGTTDVSFHFQTCVMDLPTNSLTLNLYRDYSDYQNLTFTVVVRNVKTTARFQDVKVYGKMYSNIDGSVISEVPNFSGIQISSYQAQRELDYKQLRFYKEYNYPGLYSTFHIEYPFAFNLTSDSKLVIQFPTTYLPQLSHMMPIVRINGLVTLFEMNFMQGLNIYFQSSSQQVQINNNIINNVPTPITYIQIENVCIPPPILNTNSYNQNLGRVFIGLMQNSSTSLFQEASEILISQPNNPLAPSIQFFNLSFNSYATSHNTNMLMSFLVTDLQSILEVSPYNVTIYFPFNFSSFFSYNKMSCSIGTILATTIQSASQQYSDCENQLILNDNYVLLTNIIATNNFININNDGVSSPKQIISIALGNFPTPQDSTYDFCQVYAEFNRQDVRLFQSTKQSNNYGNIQFLEPPNTLGFYDSQQTDVSQMTLTRGIYTTLYIRPNQNAKFSKVVFFDLLSNSELQIQYLNAQNINQVEQNAESLGLLLAFPNTAMPGEREIRFNKREFDSASVYSALPILKLKVDIITKKVIQVNRYNLDIPLLGFSVPLYFSLADMLPLQPFVVQATLPTNININGSVVAFFRTSSACTLSLQNPSCYIILQANNASTYQNITSTQFVNFTDNGINIYSSFPLTLTILNQDNLLYYFANNGIVNVRIISNYFPPPPPILQFIPQTYSDFFATKYIANYNVTQNNVFLVWACELYDTGANTTTFDIAFNTVTSVNNTQSAQAQEKYDFNQAQYNIEGIQNSSSSIQSNITQQFMINNLLPNKRYRLKGWAVDQQGNIGYSGEHVFYTSSNQGVVRRILFQFERGLNLFEQKEMCCFMYQYLNVTKGKFERFISGQGISCSDQFNSDGQLIQNMNLRSRTLQNDNQTTSTSTSTNNANITTSLNNDNSNSSTNNTNSTFNITSNATIIVVNKSITDLTDPTFQINNTNINQSQTATIKDDQSSKILYVPLFYYIPDQLSEKDELSLDDQPTNVQNAINSDRFLAQIQFQLPDLPALKGDTVFVNADMQPPVIASSIVQATYNANKSQLIVGPFTNYYFDFNSNQYYPRTIQSGYVYLALLNQSTYTQNKVYHRQDIWQGTNADFLLHIKIDMNLTSSATFENITNIAAADVGANLTFRVLYVYTSDSPFYLVDMSDVNILNATVPVQTKQTKFSQFLLFSSKMITWLIFIVYIVSSNSMIFPV